MPPEASEAAGPADTLVSDFWPPDCETTHFCGLSSPVCGALLQQPQEMNSPILYTLPAKLNVVPGINSHSLNSFNKGI